jgi:uncharacterized membrane protein
VFDFVFRFLFKYPAVVFDEGELIFTASRSAVIWVVVAGLIAAAALFTYRGIENLGTRRDKAVLLGLRLCLVAVLVLCLFRPTLLLRAAVPQQNFLGILIDDSRSMQITDQGDQPRSAFVEQEFGAEGVLRNALADRFVLRFFRFSSSAARTPGPEGLTYEGTATRLGTALERARDELSGLPLAGVVMVTDGADTSDAVLDEPLAGLRARSIPVFTVGVGEEQFARDIQISRVETPRTILKGTSIAVDVVISHTGFAGREVTLQVEDEGRLVSSENVTLPRDGEAATVRVNFTGSEAGPRLFRFRVPTVEGEQVTQNNTRDALIRVTDRPERILYMEGEPRAEVKFLRRAVEDDENIEVVLVLRTAEEKYWRGGVRSADELAAGFPRTREELFAYRAIILGSVEAAAFSPDQLRMLADFVGERGGGLIVLGGRRAFAEGGWAGTPVAEVLPVELGGSGGEEPEVARLGIELTSAGENFPVLQLADTEEASVERWSDLPELTSVNAITQAKRGATVLLTGEDGGQSQIVLAYHRYGRGKVMAFPVQDSWIWQMDASIAVDDMTHEILWRRLLRWLVDGVPDNVSLTTATDRVEPGELVTISSEVVDQAFVAVNDAQVTARVTAPDGTISDVPLEWTVAEDGKYEGTFVAEQPGLYEILGNATRGETSLGTNTLHVRASAGDDEYFDAAMRSSLLTRIAEETGGRFFTSAPGASLTTNVSSLPEAISYSGRGVTVVEERDLWDMPVLLLLLLTLVGAEWGWRRKRGLA